MRLLLQVYTDLSGSRRIYNVLQGFYYKGSVRAYGLGPKGLGMYTQVFRYTPS